MWENVGFLWYKVVKYKTTGLTLLLLLCKVCFSSFYVIFTSMLWFGPFEYLILPINGDCCDPKKTEVRIETKIYNTTL